MAHAFGDGTTTHSASAPGRFIPTDARSVQAEVRPNAHWRHAPHGTLGSTTTVSPTRDAGTPSPTQSMRPNAS